VNETHLSRATLSAGDTAQLQGRSGAPAAGQRPPQADARRSGWTGGRIATLVIGVVLVLLSLALLGGGGTGLWAELTQRDAGYVTTGVHEFSTTGSALATEPTHLDRRGSAGSTRRRCLGTFGSGSRR